MQPMKSILFVCLGNICRSPMAEYIFKDLVAKSGLSDQFEIASAATSDEEHGNPVYPPAKRKLNEHGISCEGHAAHQITRAEYKHYDYIVAMEPRNLQRLKPIIGDDPDGKVSLLLDHTPATDTKHHNRGIADPWYTGNFDEAYEDILIGCKALLEELKES